MVFNEKTLEEINQLNFENWIRYNIGLVRFLYTSKSRYPYEIIECLGTGVKLTKLLRRGVQFGVITSNGRAKSYTLTEAGRSYYRKFMTSFSEEAPFPA